MVVDCFTTIVEYVYVLFEPNCYHLFSGFSLVDNKYLAPLICVF